MHIHKTILTFMGGVAGLMVVLWLSPSDWPANTHDRPPTPIPLPAPRIGDLGGYPVSLPNAKTHLVEYDDSPGFDREKIKRYRPPPRTYHSIIKSFGYVVRYSDGEIYDVSRYSRASLVREKFDAAQKWVNVGISSGGSYREPGYLNAFLQAATSPYGDEVDVFVYSDIDEKQFDLDVYAQMTIYPKTGRTFRETDHTLSADVFVHKEDGHQVSTYINVSSG